MGNNCGKKKVVSEGELIPGKSKEINLNNNEIDFNQYEYLNQVLNDYNSKHSTKPFDIPKDEFDNKLSKAINNCSINNNLQKPIKSIAEEPKNEEKKDQEKSRSVTLNHSKVEADDNSVFFSNDFTKILNSPEMQDEEPVNQVIQQDNPISVKEIENQQKRLKKINNKIKKINLIGDWGISTNTSISRVSSFRRPRKHVSSKLVNPTKQINEFLDKIEKKSKEFATKINEGPKKKQPNHKFVYFKSSKGLYNANPTQAKGKKKDIPRRPNRELSKISKINEKESFYSSSGFEGEEIFCEKEPKQNELTHRTEIDNSLKKSKKSPTENISLPKESESNISDTLHLAETAKDVDLEHIKIGHDSDNNENNKNGNNTIVEIPKQMRKALSPEPYTINATQRISLLGSRMKLEKKFGVNSNQQTQEDLFTYEPSKTLSNVKTAKFLNLADMIFAHSSKFPENKMSPERVMLFSINSSASPKGRKRSRKMQQKPQFEGQQLDNFFFGEVIYCSLLEKITSITDRIFYSTRFCSLTSTEFKCFKSKEEFILLQRPALVIKIENITHCKIVNMNRAGIQRNNRIHFCIKFKKLNDTESSSTLTKEFNIEDNQDGKPNKKFDIEFFSSENGQIIKEWVTRIKRCKDAIV